MAFVTAGVEDLHVRKILRFAPLLEILSDLIDGGVIIRLMHAKRPGGTYAIT